MIGTARRRLGTPWHARVPAALPAVAVATVALVVVPVLLAAAAFTGFANSNAPQITTASGYSAATAVQALSPWAYWRLGETAGTAVGSVADASGNGRPATMSTAGVTRGVDGAILGDSDAAYRFDGDSGCLVSTVTHANPTTFSIALWFRTTSTLGGGLVEFGTTSTPTPSTPQNDRKLYLTSNGQLAFGTNPSGVSVVTSPGTYNDGAWHHVAATLGPGGQRLYVDGVLVASSANTGAENVTGYWRAGCASSSGWPDLADEYLAGDLDDVAIFTTELGATAVAGLFRAAPPRHLTEEVVPNASPWAWWRLGEATGTTGADTSGSGRVLTTSATGLTRMVDGVVPGDTATTFDGVTGCAVHTTSVTNPTTFSLEVWFRTTSTAGGSLVAFSDASGLPPAAGLLDRQLHLLATGELRFWTAPAGVAAIQTTLRYNDGLWHHAVATFGSSGQRLFVDGQLVASSATTGAASFTGWWRIGCANGSPYLAATLDEVAVYPTELDAAQVAQRFHAALGTRGYPAAVSALSPWGSYRLAERSGTTLTDTSGNNRSATGSTTGRLGGAPGAVVGDPSMRFDGTSGCAVVSTTVTNPTTFTLATWFRTTATTTGALIGLSTSTDPDTSGSGDRTLALTAGGLLRFWATNPAGAVTSTRAYNDGLWHHAVATHGPAGTRLYVDGALVASTAGTGGASYTGNWHLGCAPTEGFFDGTLDDVSIFVAQLNDATVSALYRAGVLDRTARAAVQQSGPTLRWAMEETSGTTLADASGNSRGGTLSGTGITYGAAGIDRTGTALTFDGSSGCAVSTNSFAAPTTFSLELWFRTTTTQGGGLIGFSSDPSPTAGGGAAYDRNVYVRDDGRITFGTWDVGAQTTTSTAPYKDGVWHHVAATFGAGGTRLYVDGTLVGTHATSTTGTYTGWWHVGCAALGLWPSEPTSRYLAGTIDEVAVHSVELDPATIAWRHQLGVRGEMRQPAASLTGTPTLRWRLGESSGNPVDSSGNGRNGTASGGGITYGASGAPAGETDTAATFNGSTGCLVSNASFANPQNISIELWFRTTTSQGGALVGLSSTSTPTATGGAYDRHVYLRDDGRLTFGVYPSSYQAITTTTAYNDGLWHHVVATIGADGQKLYVDGQLAASGATTTAQNFTGWWKVGCTPLFAWPSRPTSDFVAATIDEVGIYPTQLSAAAVRWRHLSGLPDWTPPGPPTAVAAAAGDTQATVSWTAPVAGRTPTGYTATATAAGQTTRTCTTATTACTITGLTNGATYTVSVTASNEAGAGAASTTTTVTPYPTSVMTAGAGMVLWLDGADTATMFQDTAGTTAATTAGQSVARWNDKSTQANHATQSTAGQRPTLATVSSRALATFDGTDDNLVLDPTKLPNGTTASTTFAVGRTTEATPASSGYRTLVVWGTANSGQTRAYQKLATSANVGVVAHGQSLSAGGAITANSFGLLDDEWSSASYTGRWNGVRGSTVSVATTTGTTYALVGAQAGPGQAWLGELPEILVFNTTLTETQRRAVQDYLATKWAVTIAPGQPTGMSATAAGPGTATVSWTAPTATGGASITSYTATATAGGQTTRTCTATAPATTCDIVGLTAGVSYSVAVAATNSAGTGPASTAASVTPAAGVLDGLSSSAQAAYSVRKLRAAYTGSALQVRRSSDDATQDIGFTAAGDLDTAALLSFVGSGSGFVTTWYDQTGNSRNATQATTARQPRIVNAGAVEVTNSRANAVFSGSQQLATGTSAVTVGTTAITGNAVSLYASSGATSPRTLSFAAAASSNDFDNASSATLLYRAQGSGSVTAMRDTTVLGQVPLAFSTLAVQTSLFDGTNNTLLAQAVPGTAASSGSFAATGSLQLGANKNLADTNATLTGSISEATFFTAALSTTDRTTLERDQGTYYSITLAPTAPQSVSATNADGQSVVSWSAPSSTGGAAITGYTATATATGQTTRTCTSASTGCTITGLVNGATYSITVTATNSVGTGVASTAVTVTPFPSVMSAGNGMVLWLDGADTSTLFQDTAGSVPATTAGQTVARWNDKSTQANHATQTTAADRPALATIGSRLLPTFDGTTDALSLDVTKMPTGTTASTTLAVGRLTDPAPASSGWRSLVLWGSNSAGQLRSHTKVINSAAAGFDNFGTVSSAGTWATNTMGLLESSFTSAQYTARFNANVATTVVTSSNTGTSFASIASNPGADYWIGQVPEIIVFNTTLTETQRRAVQDYLATKWGLTIAPAQPTGPTATATGVGAANVSWTAPTSTGGAAITGYTATAVAGGQTTRTCTATAPTTTCTVGSLTPGVSYTVTVAATNSAGTGPSSTGVSVTANSGVLDQLSSSPAAAYSLRKLRFAYAGNAIQVRRSSDNATQNIGFTAAGDLDTTSLLAFTGSSSAFVTTWYDQTGNGRDATQGTTARQPRIVNAGTLDTSNGRATVIFSGSQQLLTGTSAVPVGTSGLTGNAVGGYTTGGQISGRNLSFSSSAASVDYGDTASAVLLGLQSSGATVGSFRNLATLSTRTAIYDTLLVQTATFDGSTNTVFLLGTPGTAVSSSGTFAANGAISIGANKDYTDTQGRLTGPVSEATLFAANLSTTDRDTLERDQATYYSVSMAPSAPQSLSASWTGNGGATVSWTAPSSNGGSAITAYNVSATASGQTTRTCSTATTSCSLTSLTDGVTYTVTVTATNATGTGAPSSAVSLQAFPSLLSAANGLVLWLDAADTATMWQDTAATTAANTAGQTVARWNDKSTQTNNGTQSTSTQRPTLVSSGGRLVPTFDGANDFLALTPSSLPTGTSNSTAFAVAELTTFDTSAWRWGLSWGSSTSGQGRGTFGKFFSNTAMTATVQATTDVTDTNWPSGSPALFTSAYASGTSISAASNARPYQSSSTTYNTGTSIASVGRQVTGTEWWAGRVHETIVFNRTLTADERRTIDEYLARKWSLTITPGAPTSYGLTKPTSTTATVSWAAPTWNGGSAVTSYSATVSRSGYSANCSGSATFSCNVSGLTPGLVYNVTITATNSVGQGTAYTTSWTQ